MATVRFGGGVAEMRASVAGNVFSRNRGGAYVRNRVTPLNPQTVNQTFIRDIMSDAAGNWGALLTQAQRDQWTSFAVLYPVTNVFGESVVLTGQQFYARVFADLVRRGLTALVVPGANMDVVQLLTLTSTFTLGAPSTFSVAYTPTPIGALTHLSIWATPAMPPGRKYAKNLLRLIFTSAVNAASPAAIYAAWGARFGADPVAGQRIVTEAHAINSANGSTGVRLRADAIVV